MSKTGTSAYWREQEAYNMQKAKESRSRGDKHGEMLHDREAASNYRVAKDLEEQGK